MKTAVFWEVSILTMDAVSPSETAVNIYHTAR
jgi:hypothetical protein